MFVCFRKVKTPSESTLLKLLGKFEDGNRDFITLLIVVVVGKINCPHSRIAICFDEEAGQEVPCLANILLMD